MLSEFVTTSLFIYLFIYLFVDTARFSFIPSSLFLLWLFLHFFFFGVQRGGDGRTDGCGRTRIGGRIKEPRVLKKKKAARLHLLFSSSSKNLKK